MAVGGVVEMVEEDERDVVVVVAEAGLRKMGAEKVVVESGR